MNNITYLEAYATAMEKMIRIRERRSRGGFGIMIDKDVYALEYQKRNRQAVKFYTKLEGILGKGNYGKQ